MRIKGWSIGVEKLDYGGWRGKGGRAVTISWYPFANSSLRITSSPAPKKWYHWPLYPYIIWKGFQTARQFRASWTYGPEITWEYSYAKL